MYNHSTFVGHLGSDAKQFKKDDGSNFASFSIAVRKNGGKKGGEEVPPLWVNVVCFNKTADFAGQYLKSGDLVLVEGEVELETYTPKDKPTEKRTNLKLVASRVVSLRGKKDASGSQPQAAGAKASSGVDVDVPF